MANIVGVLRLSMATEESTSIERQKEAILRWAELMGHNIIAWTYEDIDVSGAVSPWDRPGFGKWLNEPPQPFDGFCAWKLDRYSRSLLNFAQLMAWAQESGKSLATSDNQLDTSTPAGRAMANMMATFAEFEREMISSRAQSSQNKLRAVGRWHGGQIPFGYKKVKALEGYRLEVDPETAKFRVEMIDLRLGGLSLHQIARRFNEVGVTTPRGHKWSAAAVSKCLHSPASIGQRTHNGRVIRGADGLPIQFAEPLISQSKYSQLQDALANEKNPRNTAREMYALRGLMSCGACDKPLYLSHASRTVQGQRKRYRYYRCGDVECAQRFNVNADQVDKQVFPIFLDEMGDKPVTERVYVSGEDHTEELSQLNAAIEGVREEADAGLYDDDRKGYLERLKRLQSRRDALAALPDRPAGWEIRQTGELYRDVWERANEAERNKLLSDLGVMVTGYRDMEPEEGQGATIPLGYVRVAGKLLSQSIVLNWVKEA